MSSFASLSSFVNVPASRKTVLLDLQGTINILTTRNAKDELLCCLILNPSFVDHEQVHFVTSILKPVVVDLEIKPHVRHIFLKVELLELELAICRSRWYYIF